jgi:cobalamin biosynthesis Mg chelatase CobN
MGIAQASDAQHPVGSEEADAAALKTQGVPVKDTHAADSHAADSHAADSHAADAHEAKTHSVEKTEDKAAEATESKHTQESKDSHVSKEKAEPKSASVSHGLSWFVGVFALIAILVFLFT